MFDEFDHYERFMGRWSRLLAPRLVELAGVRDGERVLDVGSGTGALATCVAERNPRARVTGVDPSEAYVAHARSRARGGGATFEVADARALPWEDGTFDRCLSLFALNFVPDCEAALCEMRRVTRPGGTLAVAVWDYADGMAMLRAFWDAAVALAPEAEARDEKHMPCCREGELPALFEACGLGDVELAELSVEQPFASFDDYWSPFLLGTGPAGVWTAALDEPRRAALRERLRASLAPHDAPFTLVSRAWAARGRVAP